MRRRPKSALTIVVWAVVVAATMIVARWQKPDDAAATATPAPSSRTSASPTAASPTPSSPTPSSPTPASPLERLDAVERAQLEKTVALIEKGGPFPYPKDGTVFSNRERRLPAKPRGYYREYSVPTPGAKNRGARRVVRGSDGETWYTRDHYETFMRIE